MRLVNSVARSTVEASSELDWIETAPPVLVTAQLNQVSLLNYLSSPTAAVDA